MRIASIVLTKFRRFAELQVKDIPQTAKLVVLAGPNGSGKSSLFDAFVVRARTDGGVGLPPDDKYYNRDAPEKHFFERVEIRKHDGGTMFQKGSVYIRTAYRNDPEFTVNRISRQSETQSTPKFQRLIEADATVAENYQRMAAQALEDVFVNENAQTTFGTYRDRLVAEVGKPLNRLFPDLTFVGSGNPLDQGSFRFNKGKSQGFDYKNLSGGEKAAFDLILDIVTKRKVYADAIYCIDEPETHMNTKLQGALLGELVDLLPGNSQLWIASHSIGMMRKARELYIANPASVTFLDFGGHDFDKAVVLTPSKPTRVFWESVMHVALDDLASLVAPRQVVICEGSPAGAVPGKNAEHDARVYSVIFADEMPDVTFISAGNAKEVAGDFLGLAAVLPKVASGMEVTRVIDLDDHAPADVQEHRNKGITVLGRRHMEAYLYDDEVLIALCNSVLKPEEAPAVLAAKVLAINQVTAQGFPADDVKKAAGQIYVQTKRILGLLQVGNDQMAFTRNTLAPLVKPGMAIYEELKRDIFG